MRVPTHVLGVLTGVTLAPGCAALAAPTARADLTACTNMVRQPGVGVSDAVTAARTREMHNDLRGCVSALTEAGVPGGAATDACRMAANPP